MINRLVGVHAGMDESGSNTVDVNGVGYRVQLCDRDRDIVNRRGMGGDVVLHTKTIQNESEISLYGFLEQEDRAAFERLLFVKGFGPRTGMRLLSLMSASQLKEAIAENAVGRLRKVPGIGEVMAKKIIAEAEL